MITQVSNKKKLKEHVHSTSSHTDELVLQGIWKEMLSLPLQKPKLIEKLPLQKPEQIENEPRTSDAFHTVSFGIIRRQWEQQKASNVVHIHNALLPVKGMSIPISHKIHDTSIASSEPSRTVPSQCQLGSKKHVAGVRSSCPCRSQTSPTASSLKQLCCDR